MSHPMHPALVHFPIACWSLATLADVLGIFIDEPTWRAACWLIATGNVTAIAAMGAGLFELRKVDPSGAAMRDANRHLLLAMTAWCLYGASLLARLDRQELVPPGVVAIGLGAAGFLALAGAGYLGGRLVYTHRVGIGDGVP